MEEKEDLEICATPVTLQYLLELDSTTMQGILAKDVVLYVTKTGVPTTQGEYVGQGETVEVEAKKASMFRRSKGRVKSLKRIVSFGRGKLEFKKREHWSVDDVVEYVIAPAVKERGENCALAYTLDPRHVSTKEYDGYFVSVPGDVWFHGFVVSLATFFADQDPTEVFLWVDFIQVDPTMDPAKRQMFEANIAEYISKCKGHLVYFDGWGAVSNSTHRKRVTALEDVRCLWDLYCANVSGVDTMVTMRPPTRGEFFQSMREGGLGYFESHLRALFLPDETNRLVDYQGIMNDIKGGKEGWLHGVRLQLEYWFARQFADEAEKLKRKRDILYEQTARDLNKVAIIHSRHGDVETAIQLFRDVIELRIAGNGDDHPSIAYAKNNLALLLEKEGKYDEAEALLEDAIKILEEAKGDFSSRIAVIVGNLANVIEKKGDLEQAVIERKRFLMMRKTQFGDEHKEVAKALNALGAVLLKVGQVEPAKEALLEALGIWERIGNTADEKFSEIIDNLAMAYELDHEHEHPEHGGAHQVGIAKALFNLALLYKQLEEEDHSASYGSRAVAIMEDVLGEDHPETQKYRSELLTED